MSLREGQKAGVRFVIRVASSAAIIAQAIALSACSKLNPILSHPVSQVPAGDSAQLNQEIAAIASEANQDPTYALTQGDLTLLEEEHAADANDIAALTPFVAGK